MWSATRGFRTSLASADWLPAKAEVRNVKSRAERKEAKGEELTLYSADEETARDKVQSMVDDYGCTEMTEAQIEALTEFYTEKPSE
jgi:hypothetical protein